MDELQNLKSRMEQERPSPWEDLPDIALYSIHPCGFYKNKAKNIKACSQKLLDDFGRNCAK